MRRNKYCREYMTYKVIAYSFLTCAKPLKNTFRVSVYLLIPVMLKNTISRNHLCRKRLMLVRY